MPPLMVNHLIDRTLNKLEAQAESAILKSVQETFQIALGELEPKQNPLHLFYQNIQREFWLQLLKGVERLRSLGRQNTSLLEQLLRQIDHMSKPEFTAFLSRIFCLLGYTVEVIPAQKNIGADLLIAKNGIPAVVKAQHSQTAVGSQWIYEVLAAQHYYQTPLAFVITNDQFLPKARMLAGFHQVQLWERCNLKKVLHQLHLSEL